MENAVADAQMAQEAAVATRWAETFELIGGLTAGHAILEIGSGRGRMAVAIGKRFKGRNTYLGFDAHRDDVADCEHTIAAKYPGFRFVHLDVHNAYFNPAGSIDPHVLRFPTPDASVDFCFAASIFTHLLGTEATHFISEAARVTRHGGVFFSTWFMFDEVAEQAIDDDRARYRFPHELVDGTRLAVNFDPVAHPRRLTEALLQQAGFATEFQRGGWVAPKVAARHSQDILIGRRL